MQDYIKIIRPTQWLKNLMIFFPPFLGGQFFAPGLFKLGVLPFVSFCLASSATYVVNDIFDASKDACHPKKKKRPIPSGRISKDSAVLLAVALIVCALAIGIYVSSIFLLILLTYLVLTFAYSVKLKQIAVVDIFCISAGFLLRLYAGGEAFSIVISQWLFLCVFLLSIFLSAGKRYAEIQMMGESAGEHRESLTSYPPGALDRLLYVTGAAVLVAYIMFVTTRPSLIYTVPLCAFGLLRYLVRVKSGYSGDPTESLLKDFPLCVTGFLWAVLVGWSIY